MGCLAPEADRIVRAAVDAYFEGHLRPEIDGETVFETRNSRYRLMDGVLFSSSDPSMIGAELVGWFLEAHERSGVGPSWVPGSRAVLVDRNRGRYIIVTSTARLVRDLHVVEEREAARDGSPPARGGSVPTHAMPANVNDASPAARPAKPAPSSNVPTSPRRLPIPPCPPSPIQRPARTEESTAAKAKLPRLPPLPQDQGHVRASTTPPTNHGPTNTIRGVHPPPRPIRRPSGVAATAHGPRPLPYPSPPPPRPSSPSLAEPPPRLSREPAANDDMDPTERHSRASLPLPSRKSFSPDTIPTPPPSGEAIPLAQRRLST